MRVRRPVGYVELTYSVGLVGSDGSVYREQTRAPRDLPRLPDVPVSSVGDSYRSHLSTAGAAAFAVASSLDPRLQKSIASIDAVDERSVTLTTDDGVVVQWGSTSGVEAKSRLLTLLMRRLGWGTQITKVNITAPDAPAID